VGQRDNTQQRLLEWQTASLSLTSPRLQFLLLRLCQSLRFDKLSAVARDNTGYGLATDSRDPKLKSLDKHLGAIELHLKESFAIRLIVKRIEKNSTSDRGVFISRHRNTEPEITSAVSILYCSWFETI